MSRFVVSNGTGTGAGTGRCDCSHASHHLQTRPTRPKRRLSKMAAPIAFALAGALAAQAKPPGALYNLTGWSLDTCYQDPRAVDMPELQYYTSDHFYLDDDGAMVMRSPDNASGITTHADHPRTEFREVGVDDWKWISSTEHFLSFTSTVTIVSSTNEETILCQIHGSVDEEIAKILKVRWTAGLLEARVKNTTKPYDEFGLSLGKFELGDELHITVKALQGLLTVSVNNANTVHYNPPWNDDDRYYFKAGSYNQCRPCETPGEVSEVRMTYLNTRHYDTLVEAS